MNKKEHIDKLIEEAISSVDNIQRAVPAPYLLTRINARLKKTTENVWEKAGWFVGRPSIAISGLAILIFINIMAVVFKKPDRYTAITEQSAQAPADEFSYTVATIYDIENTEP